MVTEEEFETLRNEREADPVCLTLFKSGKSYTPDYTKDRLEVPQVMFDNVPAYMAIPKSILIKMLKDLITDPEMKDTLAELLNQFIKIKD